MPTPERKERLGQIEWLDLTVKNAEQIRAFYEAVVGWSSDGVAMATPETGPYHDYCVGSNPKSPTGGICHARGENTGIPSVWIPYINVDSLEVSLAEAVVRGGTVIGETRVMTGSGKYCLIRDPSGAHCALFEPE